MLASCSPVGLFFLFFFSRSISRSVFHDLFAISFLIEALWPQISLQAVWNCYIMICCLALYSASSWIEPVQNEQVKPPAWCDSLRNQSFSINGFSRAELDWIWLISETFLLDFDTQTWLSVWSGVFNLEAPQLAHPLYVYLRWLW